MMKKPGEDGERIVPPWHGEAGEDQPANHGSGYMGPLTPIEVAPLGERAFHASHLADARAELGNGNPDRALLILGNRTPRIVPGKYGEQLFPTLHLAQRWHHIRAEAYLVTKRPLLAVSQCEKGLELATQHGEDDPDQILYTATLFCTLMESKRRSGGLTREDEADLQAFAAEALIKDEGRWQIMAAYAERTLGLHARKGVARLAPASRTSPLLSPAFNLPY